MQKLIIGISVIVAGIGRTVSYFKLRDLADYDFSCEQRFDPLPPIRLQILSLYSISTVSLTRTLSSLLLDRALDLHRAHPWRHRRLPPHPAPFLQWCISRIRHPFHSQPDQSSFLALSQRFPQRFPKRFPQEFS